MTTAQQIETVTQDNKGKKGVYFLYKIAKNNYQYIFIENHGNKTK